MQTSLKHSKLGRPTKYKASHCEDVVELGRQGLSLSQIAAKFDVARSTIDHWASNHDEFSEALTRAKTFAQAWWETKAQEALFDRKFNSAVWKKTVEARFREDYTIIEKPKDDYSSNFAAQLQRARQAHDEEEERRESEIETLRQKLRLEQEKNNLKPQSE